MTYSVEFGVSVGQWEYVHFTIDGQDFVDRFVGKDQDMEVLLGDYHASLRAAVLHGRDMAKQGVSQQAEELIKSELGGKIIKTTDNEALRELESALLDSGEPKVGDQVTVAGTTFTKVSDKPWERPVKAAASKPWESGTPVVTAALLDTMDKHHPQGVSGLEDF